MPEAARSLALTVNGASIAVSPGTTVAAAVLMAGAATRLSVTGELRAPLCGMGICFECRVSINGVPHQRSCQILCQSGMHVLTAAAESSAEPFEDAGVRQQP
jgi:D-hydroxyproline dehydrogenase subunit gamma